MALAFFLLSCFSLNSNVVVAGESALPSFNDPVVGNEATGHPFARTELEQVKDLLYLIQADDISVSAFANNQFDMVVMDYAKYGDAASEYTADEIDRIKSGDTSGCQKVVLAYMSIGEAEDYRFYWDPAWRPGDPAWLGPTNPEWEGNYKVRYWMSGWQNIVYGTAEGPDKTYLDRIIDQGFDGVYLDIIDAYEYWSSAAGGNERTRIQARTDMVDFVKALGEYARVTRGKENFLIFPQNGADIIYDDDGMLDALGLQYLNACDGLGQEDTWYMGMTPQPQAEIDRLTRILDIYRANGKVVLSVDYLWNGLNPDAADNKERFNDYYTKVYAKGYIPYAADANRDLNSIVTVVKGNGYDFSQPVISCPACSGADVVVTDTTFLSGTLCTCIGSESIVIGPRVTIQNGAEVTFRAPEVSINSFFHAEKGAVVHIEHRTGVSP